MIFGRLGDFLILANCCEASNIVQHGSISFTYVWIVYSSMIIQASSFFNKCAHGDIVYDYLANVVF